MWNDFASVSGPGPAARCDDAADCVMYGVMHGAARARIGRSCLMLVLGLALSLAGPALRANPLTEIPGTRPPAPEAEAPPPRDEAAERAEAGATNPAATAIIRSLAPFADGNSGAPARPLSVSPDDGGPALRIDPARSVDLTVFFTYDSTRLMPEARIQLEPLGQALQSRDLARHGFLIAGHTDAAGGLLYNRRLSFARARAVKAHLVEAYGIDPDRLRVHGWGPTRLKDPESPLSRINRRVEVSLIAPRTSRLHFHVPILLPILLPIPLPISVQLPERCAEHRLADPRRFVRLDLDDFDAAPTPLPCGE